LSSEYSREGELPNVTRRFFAAASFGGIDSS
jgi:hypothetical protein